MGESKKIGILLVVALILLQCFSVGSSAEFTITTDVKDQWEPAIYGDTVVWTDERNGNMDIYEYDLKRIAYNYVTKTVAVAASGPYAQWYPAVYDSMVLWTQEKEDTQTGNLNTDIYLYNLATSQEMRITYDFADQWAPAIYGDHVVWTDNRDGNLNIYGVTLSPEEAAAPEPASQKKGTCLGTGFVAFAVILVVAIRYWPHSGQTSQLR
jgi:beta propeller repeat protein